MADTPAEQYGQGDMPPVSDAQRQAIIDEYRAQAAGKAPEAGAGKPQVEAAASGDAGPQVAQMTDRGPLLPAEEAISKLFDQLKAQSERLDAMQGELTHARQQAQAARQLAGPPAIATYAAGIAAKLKGHRDANPDLPRGHFDAAIADAEELATHAAALGDGNPGAAQRLEGLASKVGRFVTRTHLRKTGKHLDMSAVVDELESVLDEADRLTSHDQGKAPAASSGELVKAG